VLSARCEHASDAPTIGLPVSDLSTASALGGVCPLEQFEQCAKALGDAIGLDLDLWVIIAIPLATAVLALPRVTKRLGCAPQPALDVDAEALGTFQPHCGPLGGRQRANPIGGAPALLAVLSVVGGRPNQRNNPTQEGPSEKQVQHENGTLIVVLSGCRHDCWEQIREDEKANAPRNSRTI